MIKRFLNLASFLLFLGLVSGPEEAFGQSAPASPAPPALEAKLSLSFQESRGNSRSATRQAELDLTRTGKKWSFGSSLSFERGEASGSVHTDQRFGDLWIQRSLGSRFSLVAGGEVYRNPQAGKHLRTLHGFGITGTLVSRPRWQLSPSLKLGWQQEDFMQAIPDDRFRVFLIEADGSIQLSKTASFTHEISYRRDLTDSENNEVIANLALTSQINKVLALQWGYDLQYDPVPVAGRESTDSSVNVSLVFDLARNR